LANAKYSQTEWTQRLEQYFPHGEMLAPSWRYFQRLRVELLEPGAERPVRVITVPKTLKTPRVISIEPTAMQYVQQGLLESLEDSLQRDNLLWSIMGWRDQTPNRDLALVGSRNGNLATLDLSEASDRVSNQLVRGMLKNHPHLAAGVDACRSRKADVPDHGVVRLAKFASMGSALCFPFEAMVFTTIVFLGIERTLNTRMTRKLVKAFLGKVRVYGDDIIVPVKFVPSVVGLLENFGFRVNRDKSFWTGKFRESCGRDAYAGVDITITKVRSLFPVQQRHVPVADQQEFAERLVSTVSLRNQLYIAGFWRTVRWLDDYIGKLIPFPAVSDNTAALGKFSYLGFETQRIDRHLQRPMVKAAVMREVIPESKLDDFPALLKFFLKRGEQPFVDERHLERAGRPDRVYINIRWTFSD